MVRLIGEMEEALETRTFSPPHAARVLCELVRAAETFGATEACLNGVDARREDCRTALALELAAASLWRRWQLRSCRIWPRSGGARWASRRTVHSTGMSRRRSSRRGRTSAASVTWSRGEWVGRRYGGCGSPSRRERALPVPRPALDAIILSVRCNTGCCRQTDRGDGLLCLWQSATRLPVWFSGRR